MSDLERRQKLMSDLLSGVQQCQVRYGGKSELATESEEVKKVHPLKVIFALN